MRNAQYQVAVNLHGKVIRVREPDYGSWVGVFPGFSLLCVCGTVSETVTVMPVSTMWQWWVRRSSRAAVIFVSLKTRGHSPKARWVVMVRTLRVRS